MINGNNSYAQSIGTNMQNTEGVFLKEPVPAPDLIEKSITDNGDYSAKADGADGYSSVDVNVANSFTPADEGEVVSDGALVAQTSESVTSNGTVDTTTINSLNVDVANSYSQADNGKVVSNQELVAQTAYPTEITENDTYDTTNYNSITVNVSGGGGNATFATATKFNYVNDYLSLLTNIDIPDGVESIGDSAFSYCVSLTSITIPNSVTSIGEDAFNGCGSLETVTFESNSSLESIGLSAFYECGSLTSITIPNSVTTIESSVFMSCSSLTSITFEPTTPPTLSVGLGIPTTCIIRVPQGTLSAYTSAENYPDPSEYSYEEY